MRFCLGQPGSWPSGAVGWRADGPLLGQTARRTSHPAQLVLKSYSSEYFNCVGILICFSATGIASEGCIQASTGTKVGAYCIENTQTRCHCWGLCGYICDPNSPCKPP